MDTSTDPFQDPETAAATPDLPSDLSDDPPRTGEDRVDAALETLHLLGSAPTDDHVAVYERVHRDLQAALAGVDATAAGSAPGPAAPPSG